jgi:Ran GTPase-activating protein (RanGAP) involved in mRNA processing and transport
MKATPDPNKVILSNLQLKLSEAAIVNALMRECIHIHEIDVSKNYIDSHALRLFISTFKQNKFIKRINLSYNPITNNGKDMQVIEELIFLIRGVNHIFEIKLDGILIPRESLLRIERSAMVNRSLATVKEPNFFNQYIERRFLLIPY